MPRQVANPCLQSMVSLTDSIIRINMHPRVRLLQSGRSIALRPKASIASSYHLPLCLRLQQRRTITSEEKPLPEAEQPKGPNQEQLPHVSEEAAMTGEIMGEGGPELDQGTPVQEVRVPMHDPLAMCQLTHLRSYNAMRKPRRKHLRSCRWILVHRSTKGPDHIPHQRGGRPRHKP